VEFAALDRTFRIAGLGVAIAVVAATVSLAQTEAPASGKSPRIVAPQLIAPPEGAQSDLQRIEPRPPLDGAAIQGNDIVPATPKPQALPAKKLLKADPLLFAPVAEQAGVLQAEGRAITISGVEPVPVDEMCGQDAGTPWPCGMAARTAFRGFLRGRAVRCEFPDGDVPETVTVPCRLGNRDLGEWLVANGWARAADENYKDAAKAAEEAKRGLFGPPPRELAASLRARAAGSPGSTVLPSGDLSILPSGADAPPEPGVGIAPPPALAPVIQSAPLPPPSQPSAE